MSPEIPTRTALPKSAVLRAEGVSAGYSGVEIIHEVSLEVQAREIVTIIGPNGAGKSTFLKAVFGMLVPTAGTIHFQDTDVTDYSAPQMVAQGASLVPQTENVFPSLTVRENLEMGGYRRGQDLKSRVEEVLEAFPILADRPGEKAGRLSGGQRQTLAIARALMLDPALLFLDEPTASLSPIVREEIFERVRDIRDSGVAVLMVEQNAKEALAHSDRGVVMVSGRKELEQSGAAMLNNPDVGRLFLGLSPDQDETPLADATDGA
jgi:ABC-type branched-subunit amino acid transport system ATPase component